jgi:signal transduction histidine kinase
MLQQPGPLTRVPSNAAQCHPGAPLQIRTRRLLIITGIWTIPVLISVLSIPFRQGGTEIHWPALLMSQLLTWYPWIVITLVIQWLALRFPLPDRRWIRNLAALSVTGFVLAILNALLLFTNEWLVTVQLFELGPEQDLAEVIRKYFWQGIVFSFSIYWIVMGVCFLIENYRRHREQEHQLTRARLAALQAQIQPHFLFNTLHAIATLMEVDIAAARAMIAKLGDLLRASLSGQDRLEVSFGEELSLTRTYLEIEQVRFADRLRITIKIAAEAEHVGVPRLILQPLVENAIRHGLSVKPDAGRLAITAEVHDQKLTVHIDDDGPGLPDGTQPGTGIGLRNVTERLARLYGNEAALTLASSPYGGCRATLVIPCRSTTVTEVRS